MVDNFKFDIDSDGYVDEKLGLTLEMELPEKDSDLCLILIKDKDGRVLFEDKITVSGFDVEIEKSLAEFRRKYEIR